MYTIYLSGQKSTFKLPRLVQVPDTRYTAIPIASRTYSKYIYFQVKKRTRLQQGIGELPN